MKSLLLIRHAETDLAGTFCGISDPPINAAGYQQIYDITARLRGEGLEAIYTSHLQRASTTAHTIATSLGVPCFVRPALREIDFGLWEGKRWAEVESADPDYATQWLESFPTLTAPEGEAPAEFEDRVFAEVGHLFNLPGSKIAVVTHAGVMRAVLSRFCALDEQQAWHLPISYGTMIRVGHGEFELLHSAASPITSSGGST